MPGGKVELEVIDPRVFCARSGDLSVYGPGTIGLLMDPTNNDGSLSAVLNDSTQTGGVSFFNPKGTVDDITLASGQFVSGTFVTQSNGQPGLQLVNTFNPGAAVAKLLRGTALNIETDLFNTSTSCQQGTTDSGQAYVLSNDGYGVVTLDLGSGTSSAENVPGRQPVEKQEFRKNSDLFGTQIKGTGGFGAYASWLTTPPPNTRRQTCIE